MSRRDAAASLYEIVSACEEIAEIVGSLTAEEYAQQRVVQLAVERLLITCGEAVSRILRSQSGQTEDWKTNPHAVVGLRNFITHDYDRVDASIVFAAAQSAAAELLEDARASLARAESR